MVYWEAMRSNLKTGCSGFSGAEWKGFFYPELLPSREYLNYYSKILPAVEINSTFYRRPTLKTLEKWFSVTPEDFKFFIKIPKTITHISKLIDTREETHDFCENISMGLQRKLAGFLFQLPPSFHYTAENLDLVITTVDPTFLNVVEFRHKSWWNQECLRRLAEHKIIFTGVSIPKDIPEEVMINSEEVLYYRFHGIPLMFKSEYELEKLEIIAQEFRNFPGISYVFFNNTWGKSGIKNALELQKIFDSF